MRIFLPCWGDTHIDLLKNCLGKSLNWPKNKAAVDDSEWIVTTDSDESLEKISDILFDIDNSPIIISLVDKTVKYNAPTVLFNVLNRTIEECVKDEEPLLMATPDYIFADGTIDSLKAIGDAPGSCVGFAHMRVLPDVLEKLNHRPPSNAELMRLGLNHPHPAWEDSEETANPGRTYYGGISWKRVGEKEIAVSHRLPAPFYVNFLKEDLEFFAATHGHAFDHTFNLWDHLWPSVLLKEGRFRYIGSSDLALMMEVTDKEANVPPINPYNVTNKDKSVHESFHNLMCKQFISTFRG